jgi:hypothetical protein
LSKAGVLRDRKKQTWSKKASFTGFNPAFIRNSEFSTPGVPLSPNVNQPHLIISHLIICLLKHPSVEHVWLSLHHISGLVYGSISSPKTST